MIVSFVYPTPQVYSGGVAALFEMANGLARRGHQVHVIHAPAWPGRIDALSDLRWFAFEPAVAHHVVDGLDDPGLPRADVLLTPHESARLGLPVAVVQGHGMIDEDAERVTFRSPCPKLCVARWLVDVGISYGAPPEQMLHVPLGIDHELFRVTTPPGARPYDVALLQGAAHPAKGWSLGLTVIEELRRRRPDLRVATFSIPPASPSLPPWIDFFHDPPRPFLAEGIYNRAKVFLQPSLYEGFGFTAVEAMACGAALVTTDNGGSRDYAFDDVTALVRPPTDADALAGAIEDLLDDDDRRQRIAAAGAEQARTFRWDRTAEVLDGHLERYLADPAAFQGAPQPSAVD